MNIICNDCPLRACCKIGKTPVSQIYYPNYIQEPTFVTPNEDKECPLYEILIKEGCADAK